MAREACFYTSIYCGVLLCLSWPFYIYSIFQWYRFWQHFVIRRRWPLLCLTMVALSMIVQLVTTVDAFFCTKIFTPVAIACSNCIQLIAFYRAQLLYGRYLRTQHHLKSMKSQTSHRRMNLTPNREIRLTRKCHFASRIWSILILIAMPVTSLAVLIGGYLNTYVLITGVSITTLIGLYIVYQNV